MVTVDLFRLSRHGTMIGHVRILRERNDRFLAIISYRESGQLPPSDLTDSTVSHRLLASSRDKAIEAALSWADSKFGNSCHLLPLRSNLLRSQNPQMLAY